MFLNLGYIKIIMQFILLVLVLLTLVGCSSIRPVTWEERIAKNKHTVKIPLFYHEKGKGSPIVLLHGLAESSYTWRYIMDDLALHHRVIAIDLKGFGRSPKPRDNLYSVYDQAIAVRQLIHDKKIKKATIIGHSFGGGVALVLAMMDKSYQQVSQLVLIDAAVYPQQLPSMLRELKRPLLGPAGLYLISPNQQARQAYQYAFYDQQKIPSEGIEEASRNLIRHGSRYALVQTVRQMVPDDMEGVSLQYKKLPHRTLIVWGEEDKIIKPENAYRLNKDLKNSQLVILEKVGHMPQEESPKKLLSLIKKFIQE